MTNTPVTEPTCRDCGSHDIETSGPYHMPLYCNDCNSEAVDFPPVKQAPREDQARSEKTVPVKPGEEVDFDTFPEESYDEEVKAGCGNAVGDTVTTQAKEGIAALGDPSDPGDYDPEIHDSGHPCCDDPLEYSYAFQVALDDTYTEESVIFLFKHFGGMQIVMNLTEKNFNIFRTEVRAKGFVLKDIARVPHEIPESVR